MKRINRVEIYNFQSHEYTDLYFNDKVNVIIGPSDSGKTAIIRAIKWVLFNEPSGSSFIRLGSDESKVILYFNDDIVIERGKSKRKNYYVLKANGREERFEGFGQNVPKEIKEITGIYKINLNNQSLIISIADQLESPFLITESPTVKSSAIGMLAGTDIIDLALADLSKEVYDNKTKLKIHENNLDLQKNELKKYGYLEEEKEKLDLVESILDKIKKSEIRLRKIKDIQERYHSILKVKSEIEYKIKKLEIVNTLEQIIADLNPKVRNMKFLANLTIRKNSIYDEIKYWSLKLDATNNIHLLDQHIDLMIKNTNQLKRLSDINNKYEYVKKHYLYNSMVINHIDSKEIDRIWTKLEKLTINYMNYAKMNNMYRELDKRIIKGNQFMDRYKFIDNTSRDLKLLEITINKYTQVLNLKNNLDIIEQKIRHLTNEIDVINDGIKNNLISYGEVLDNISNCPYCKSIIDHNHKVSIIKEMEEDYGLRR